MALPDEVNNAGALAGNIMIIGVFLVCCAVIVACSGVCFFAAVGKMAIDSARPVPQEIVAPGKEMSKTAGASK